MNKDLKDISITDIIVLAKAGFFILKRNWYIIGATCLLFFGMGVYTRPGKVFVAETSMLLKNSKGSAGGLMSVASQFGFGSSQEITYEKVVGITKSTTAIKSVLLRRAVIDGENDLLINHIAKIRELDKKWNKKAHLKSIDFTKEGFHQDSLMITMVKSVRKSTDLFENREKLIIVTSKFENEELAYAMNRNIVDYLLTFFKQSEMNDDLITQSVLKAKLDSVKSELFKSEVKLASASDNSFRVVKRQGMIDKLRAQREVRILNEMYVELIKQLELVNFRVLDKKPSLQLVDSPMMPLGDEQRGLKVILILSCISGFLVSAIGIFGVIWIKDLNKKLSAKK